jgi:MFS family permease
MIRGAQMADTQVSEFRSGWLTILASGVGVGVGLTGLPFYTFGVFMTPLEEAFGWSRSSIAAGMMFLNAGTILLSPFLGILMDRYGEKVLAVPSLIGLAVGFIALSFSGPGLTSFYLAWIAVAILGCGTTPLTWTRAVSARFNKHRGIALGLTLVGTGFASALGPGLIQRAIDMGGWQAGYRSIAVFILVVGLPLSVVGLQNRKRQKSAEKSTGDVAVAGLSFSQAFRGPEFWLIFFGIFLVIVGQAGSTVHFIPLLRDRGFSAITAASVISALGVSVILGRLLVGYLLDRFHAPNVARVFLALPALALIILLFRSDLPAAWLAAILLGIAAGAEVDLLAFLVGRYFGLRSYGAIYGVILSAFAFGGGLGPVVTGFAFDMAGNYDFALMWGAGIFCLGALLIGSLGPYPDKTELKV